MREFERRLYKKNLFKIAGLDEVGRGCLAGPLVVAICILSKNYDNKLIKDSKKMSSRNRKIVFEQLNKEALLVDWIVYDAEFVDKTNPKQTSIIGMEYLINKHKDKIDYCLIDAEKVENVLVKTQSIIKGDTKSISIAAASVIAKVVRDDIMEKLDKKYPLYGFSKNKGYGTKHHIEALVKYGPITKIHRFSYKPIKNLTLNKKG